MEALKRGWGGQICKNLPGLLLIPPSAPGLLQSFLCSWAVSHLTTRPLFRSQHSSSFYLIPEICSSFQVAGSVVSWGWPLLSSIFQGICQAQLFIACYSQSLGGTHQSLSGVWASLLSLDWRWGENPSHHCLSKGGGVRQTENLDSSLETDLLCPFHLWYFIFMSWVSGCNWGPLLVLRWSGRNTQKWLLLLISWYSGLCAFPSLDEKKMKPSKIIGLQYTRD